MAICFKRKGTHEDNMSSKNARNYLVNKGFSLIAATEVINEMENGGTLFGSKYNKLGTYYMRMPKVGIIEIYKDLNNFDRGDVLIDTLELDQTN